MLTDSLDLLYHLTPSLAQQDVKATRDRDGSANLQSISPTPLITFLEDLTRSRIPYLRRGPDAETEEGKAWNWKVVVGWWAWEVGVLGTDGNTVEEGLSTLKEKFEQQEEERRAKEKKDRRDKRDEQRAESVKSPPPPPQVQQRNRDRSFSHASVISSSELDDKAFISAVERKVNELAQRVEMCKAWLEHDDPDKHTPEEVTNAIRREAPTSPAMERPMTRAGAMSPLLDLHEALGSSPEQTRVPSRAGWGLSRMPNFNFGDSLERSSRVEDDEEERPDSVLDNKDEDGNSSAESELSSPLEAFPETSTPRANSPEMSVDSSTTEGMNTFEHSEELSFSFSAAAAQERLLNEQIELARFREAEQMFGVQVSNDAPNYADLTINRSLYPAGPLSQIDEETGEYSTRENSVLERVGEMGSENESESESVEEEEEEEEATETQELPAQTSALPNSTTQELVVASSIVQQATVETRADETNEITESQLDETNNSIQDPDWSAFVHSTLPPRPISPRKPDLYTSSHEVGTSNSIIIHDTSTPKPASANASLSTLDQNPSFSAFLDSISPPRSARSTPVPRNIPITPIATARSASSTPAQGIEASGITMFSTPVQAFRTAQSTPAPPASIQITRVRTRADSFPDITDVGDTIDLERMRKELEAVATPGRPLAEKDAAFDGDDEGEVSDVDNMSEEDEASDGESRKSVTRGIPKLDLIPLKELSGADAKDLEADSEVFNQDGSLALAVASSRTFSPKPSSDNAMVPFRQPLGFGSADETVPELDPPPFSTRRMPNLFPPPETKDEVNESMADSGAEVTEEEVVRDTTVAFHN